MSFGFGIGDFIAIFEHANRLRKDFSTAPAQYQAIATEVKNFSVLVEDVNTYFAGHSPTEAQREELSEIVLGCRQTLLEVEKVLSKYSSLESGKRVAGVRDYTKRVWQRVKLEPDDIRDFRNRIVANISLLSAYADGLERKTLTNLVSRHDDLIEKQETLLQRQSLQENQEILDWLAPADYAAQHSTHVSHRLVDTGQWLLDSPEYIQWSSRDYESNGLYLYGIPGGGKTILSSIVIDELQAKYALADDVGVCYYYCDYKRQRDQKMEQVLLRLLRQLANSIALPIVKDLYSRCTLMGTRPTLSTIKDTLHATVQQLSSIFIVVDALDECQSADGTQKALLAELSELNRLPGANVKTIITSRHLHDVTLLFKNFKSIEVLASDQDIGKYVATHIQHLPNFVAQRSDLQEEIKAAIISTVAGMFLLATLHFQALQGKRSIRQLRLTLDSLGSSSYPEAYSTTMSRICSQVEDQKNLAIDTLTWIVYAQRSLKSGELLHALAVEIDSPEFYDDDVPDIKDVLSACCGLVVVEPETQFVRLVHQTTQDFFKGRGSTWLPEAHTKLSRICNTYLAFEALASAGDQTEVVFRDLLADYPLYDYASWHWSDHAKLREDLGVEELVVNQKQIDRSSEVLMAHTVPEYLTLRRKYPGITGLHLLAYCGLTTMMPKFLERYDVNDVDDTMQTPILYAFQQNQIEAVSMLIEKGARLDDRYEDDAGQMKISTDRSTGIGDTLLFHAINLEKYEMATLFHKAGARFDASTSRKRQALLWDAVKSRNLDIVQLLIENGVEINHPDIDGQTALCITCVNGDNQMMQVLLANGANPQIPDNSGQMPIHIVCSKEDIEALQLLLERGADPNIKNKAGRTPLYSAALEGHIEIIKLLLEKNVNINTMHLDGWTSVAGAAYYGHVEVLQLLLNNGADISKATESGQTPLYAASQTGHLEIVRILLDRDAEINVTNEVGCTPLYVASEAGHLEIVRLLLDRNADINKPTYNTHTPLYVASFHGHLEVVRLLLDRDADVNISNHKGWTPLNAASERDYLEVVRLLLDKNADVDKADSKGSTPINSASRRGCLEIVRLLMNRGADISKVNNYGFTPLHNASAYGYLEVVQLILENGGIPNTKSIRGVTPLFSAAFGGHLEVVKLLQQSEASFNAKGVPQISKDSQGRTVLHCTALGGDVTTLNHLLDDDDMLADEDEFGRNILDYATISGSIEMVERILKLFKTKKLNIKSSSLWSPLHWACRNGSYEILTLLTEAGIKSQEVETNVPPASWLPFDLAVYWKNTELLSVVDNIRKKHSWLWGLVPQSHASRLNLVSLDVFRSNALVDRSQKHKNIHGPRFQCKECYKLNYCFLCKISVDKAHPSHEWDCIEPDDSTQSDSSDSEDSEDGDENEDEDDDENEDDDSNNNDDDDDESPKTARTARTGRTVRFDLTNLD